MKLLEMQGAQQTDGPLDTVRGMQILGKIRLNQHSSSTAYQLAFACYHTKVL